jgi:hypothetical protein
LAELKPSELVIAPAAPEIELAAVLTALIDVLIADVKGFVAVDAEGSSIDGIEGLEPFVKRIPPAKKIYTNTAVMIIPGAKIFREACHVES